MTSVVLPVVAFLAAIALIAFNVRHLVVQRPLEREWTQASEPDPDRRYLAILTHYPLQAGRRTSRVLGYVRLVQRRLDECDGLIGYALRANFYRQQLWTLSVWSDEASLRAFLDDIAHQQASDDLMAYVTGAETRQWWIQGHEIPPTWDDALAQLSDPSGEPFRASEPDTSNVG